MDLATNLSMCSRKLPHCRLFNVYTTTESESCSNENEVLVHSNKPYIIYARVFLEFTAQDTQEQILKSACSLKLKR